ncbi:MAG: hypothetical protein RL189_1804, partial [Pseudomonadota bacterium]
PNVTLCNEILTVFMFLAPDSKSATARLLSFQQRRFEMSQQRKVLVLYFHPTDKISRAGKALASGAASIEQVLLRDMYAIYPDYLIDVKQEQSLLKAHDLIVFQHPVHWYSCPPLLKLWIDSVLEYGWAFGSEGNQLHGKILLSAVTAGGSAEAYTPVGSNRHTIETFFSPFNQTAHLCGMRYAAPHVVYDARSLNEQQLNAAGTAYTNLLRDYLRTGELP